ncbi:hypothetical protein ACEQPO_27900 [Bacillus sp. SL00103]
MEIDFYIFGALIPIIITIGLWQPFKSNPNIGPGGKGSSFLITWIPILMMLISLTIGRKKEVRTLDWSQFFKSAIPAYNDRCLDAVCCCRLVRCLLN